MRRPVLLMAIAGAIGMAVPSGGPPDASLAARDEHIPRADGLAARKAPEAVEAADAAGLDAGAGAEPPQVLATLVQTHTGERVVLDSVTPTPSRFDALLTDRTTGAHGSLDPRLIDLLRELARDSDREDGADGGSGAPARIELVSGYRSAKLNEMLRKKGHHVASHSQHSLGHAVDFRLVPAGASDPIAPEEMRRRIRALGWDGGVGIYPLATDRFVHADVGPKRDWKN